MTALVLDRLSRVQQVKPNAWMAACPCCQSRKGRPLAVTDADGRTLLHAFCGCSTADVLGALGLTVNDLFEKPIAHRNEPGRQRVSARDVLTILDQEVTFVALLAADFLDKKTITEDDWKRLAKAARRLGNARDHIG